MLSLYHPQHLRVPQFGKGTACNDRQVPACAHVCVCSHACIYIYACARVCAHVCVSSHVRIYIYACSYVHAHVLSTSTRKKQHLDTHNLCAEPASLLVCIYLRMYVRFVYVSEICVCLAPESNLVLLLFQIEYIL